MRVTTKGRYALRAVLNLSSSNHDGPISIKKIAQEEEISPEFLEQIFFKLKKAGIINSVRGPGGGFRLNRPSDQISLKDIFAAVGEGLCIAPCSSCIEDDAAECAKSDNCVAHVVWQDATKRLNDYFEGLTIGRILAENRNGKFGKTQASLI